MEIVIEIYDPTIKKPPFKFIELDRFKTEIENNQKDLGLTFWKELYLLVFEKGFHARFYSHLNFCLLGRWQEGFRKFL